MNWSPDQLSYYQKLKKASAHRSFRETAGLCFEDCKFNPAASPAAIAAAEAELGNAFPADLKLLYSESDGVYANFGAPMVMPLKEMIKENRELRTVPQYRSLYMPFDHMLIFGAEGNGDLFFYPIHADGSLARNVFIWDHESDSREFFANGVQDLFLRHATEVMGA